MAAIRTAAALIRDLLNMFLGLPGLLSAFASGIFL
jgi:hypothetical protein